MSEPDKAETEQKSQKHSSLKLVLGRKKHKRRREHEKFVFDETVFWRRR